MDEVQVDVVETKSLERGLAGSNRVVVSLVVVPQLRGDVQLLSRHTAVPHRHAYLLFIPIPRSSVNVPVSLSNGCQYRSIGLALGRTVGAESEQRNGRAVVEQASGA